METSRADENTKPLPKCARSRVILSRHRVILSRHRVILRLSKDGRETTVTGMPILREPQDDMNLQR